jgi:hypothetical protein
MDREIEVLRVLRVPPLGRLEVARGENRYQQLADLTDPAARQLVLAAIGELVVFAGGYDVLVEAGMAPPAARPAAPAPVSDAEEQAQFLARLEQERDATLEATQSGVARAGLLRRRPKPAAPAPLDIVTEIDALLQAQLAADPTLKGRAVRLASAPAGGLRIEVDGRSYERPDQVEDAAVRQAIGAALRAWEAR